MWFKCPEVLTVFGLFGWLCGRALTSTPSTRGFTSLAPDHCLVVVSTHNAVFCWNECFPPGKSKWRERTICDSLIESIFMFTASDWLISSLCCFLPQIRKSAWLRWPECFPSIANGLLGTEEGIIHQCSPPADSQRTTLFLFFFVFASLTQSLKFFLVSVNLSRPHRRVSWPRAYSAQPLHSYQGHDMPIYRYAHDDFSHLVYLNCLASRTDITIISHFRSGSHLPVISALWFLSWGKQTRGLEMQILCHQDFKSLTHPPGIVWVFIKSKDIITLTFFHFLTQK